MNERNTLTAQLFLELYTSVGWEAPCFEQIEKALDNSAATFKVYENEKTVGMVRVIGDGGTTLYIKDFAVIPPCEAKGIGSPL